MSGQKLIVMTGKDLYKDAMSYSRRDMPSWSSLPGSVKNAWNLWANGCRSHEVFQLINGRSKAKESS